MVRIKDSLISMSGVVTAQLLLFVSIVLLGRERGPEILGQFNGSVALGTLAGTLLALRYELACLSDRSEVSFQSLVHVLALGAAVATAVAAILLAYGRYHLLLVELYAFATFIFNLAAAYLNSLKRYGLIAVARIAVNAGLLMCVASPLRGWLKVEPFFAYAIVNTVMGLLALTATLYNGRSKGYRVAFDPKFYSVNRRFAAYILPATVFGSVMTYALAIAVPSWYGAEEAGYFALAFRLGFSPVSLVGQSIGGVFRRDALGAVRANSDGNELVQVYRTYARGLIAVSLGYAFLAFVFFDPIVALFLGAKWKGATPFFYFLIPLFCVQILYVPLSQVFLTVRKQKLDFSFQLWSGSVLIATLYATHVLNLSAVVSVATFSFAGAIVTAWGVTVTARAASPRTSGYRAVLDCLT
ncbi:O-antigen/teichoic acid export membrane protein [Paraburkholderia sp. BL6669N2]|nr:O-antigen/teichoic acid export membrane protein [Paraburkholderia sp. BL6669N2]